MTLFKVALIGGGVTVIFDAAWAVLHPAFGAPYESVWWVYVLIAAAAGYVASQGRSWRLGAAGGFFVAAVDLTLGELVVSAIRPDLVTGTMPERLLAAVVALLIASAVGLVGAGVARVMSPRRPTVYALLLLLVFIAVSGHAAGIWEIPRLRWASSSPNSSAGFDPRSITVAYERVHVADATSPWSQETTERIMSRFVERWSEASLGRSRATVMDDTDLRDVLVIFSDRPIEFVDFNTTATAARFVPFAGGRLRVVEVFFHPRLDSELTAGILVHEFGHALGCCTGLNTSGGHFIGRNCTLILCSPHGSARVFSEDELNQMGLGR